MSRGVSQPFGPDIVSIGGRHGDESSPDLPGWSLSTKQVARVIGVHWVTLLRWIQSGAIGKPNSVTIRDVKHWRWNREQITQARAYKEAHGRWPNKKRQETWKRQKEVEPGKRDAKNRKAKPARDKRRLLMDAEGDRVLRELWAAPAALHDSLTILGLEDAATLEQVKAQYRELAKLYHPDKAGNNEMMVKINRAYELLCKELEPQPE